MTSGAVFARMQSDEGIDNNVRSSILNCICPGCGGALRITKSQFRCQGRCGEDWRPVWERLCSEGVFARKVRSRSVHRSVRAA